MIDIQVRKRARYAANDAHIMGQAVFDKPYSGEIFIVNEPLINDLFHQKPTTSFSYFAEKALQIEVQKQHRKEITAQTLAMFVSRLNAQLTPFFYNFDVRKIGAEEISSFIDHLLASDIKAITIKQYLGLLKRILTLALVDEAIYKIPLFPKLKCKSVPRGSFTCSEYKLLLRASKLLSMEEDAQIYDHRATAGGAFIKKTTVPKEMNWLIRFMTNSFLRPVDIKLIKHKHIEVINQGSTCYLRLNLPETKNHRGQIVTLQAAKSVYGVLKKYQADRGFGSPEDYLFIPEAKDRLGAIQLISSHFRKILQFTNLYYGQYGQARSLYSLRHTAITFRLRYGSGIDLITLARNARTSVEMIEKFYSSELSAEMNIQMLQSRRR